MTCNWPPDKDRHQNWTSAKDSVYSVILLKNMQTIILWSLACTINSVETHTGRSTRGWNGTQKGKADNVSWSATMLYASEVSCVIVRSEHHISRRRFLGRTHPKDVTLLLAAMELDLHSTSPGLPYAMCYPLCLSAQTHWEADTSCGFCLCKICSRRHQSQLNIFTSWAFVDYKWETRVVTRRCALQADLE